MLKLFSLIVILSMLNNIIYCFHQSKSNCRFNKRLGSVCVSNGRKYSSYCDYYEEKLLTYPRLRILHIGPRNKKSGQHFGRGYNKSEMKALKKETASKKTILGQTINNPKKSKPQMLFGYEYYDVN